MGQINIIRIDPYNFELHRFKVSAFLRYSVELLTFGTAYCTNNKLIYLLVAIFV